MTERCLSSREIRNSDYSCGVFESQRSELYPIAGGVKDVVGVVEKRPTDPNEEAPLLARTSANSFENSIICNQRVQVSPSFLL